MKTVRIVSAANAFLATLNDQQKRTVSFAFDDAEQSKRWSNLPTGFVPRGGVSLKDRMPPQRSAAMALVSSALSPRGFEKVRQIMLVAKSLTATPHPSQANRSVAATRARLFGGSKALWPLSGVMMRSASGHSR